jgi:hypothetical protein
MLTTGIIPTVEKLKQLCFEELGKDFEVFVQSLLPVRHVRMQGSDVFECCASQDEYDQEATEQMEEIQELESQLQVFETVMQRDVAECVTDMETTFQSAEVDLSGVKRADSVLCATPYTS